MDTSYLCGRLTAQQYSCRNSGAVVVAVDRRRATTLQSVLAGKEMFELRAKTSTLFTTGREVSCVVVELNGFVNGGRHLHLDFFVCLVGCETLTLDGYHFLDLTFAIRWWRRWGASASFRRFRSPIWRNGRDGGATSGLGTQTSRSGAAQAWRLGRFGVRSIQFGWLEMAELIPKLFHWAQIGIEEVITALKWVLGGDGGEPLLLIHLGRGSQSQMLGHDLTHGGQSRHFKGRLGGPSRGSDTRLHVHEGSDLLAEGQCLIRWHGGFALLGQRCQGVSVSSHVRLASH